MKFAHFSDVHIGAWRDPRLRDVSLELFLDGLDVCISESVDFILISGDLFNTSMPAVDHLKLTIEGLKRVQEQGIRIYYIAGSHDYSTSGKTMLDVLAAAGIAVNVARGKEVNGKLQLHFVEDPTGVKICGMIGKKGGLETAYYENLDYAHLEQESGPKIFLFHSAIEEMKPEYLSQMPAAPLSMLPKGFDYYAGGHVHVVEERDFEHHKRVVFPGPVFPCSFSELEKLGKGGFFIVDTHNSEAIGAQEDSLPRDWKTRHVPLDKYGVASFTLDVTSKSVTQVEEELMEMVSSKDLRDNVVTLRIRGVLHAGKISDINYREVVRMCFERGAKTVLRNTYDLHSAELDAIKVEGGSIEEVEGRLIEEHIGKHHVNAEEERVMIKTLMHALSDQKAEGETIATYEKRIREEIDGLLEE